MMSMRGRPIRGQAYIRIVMATVPRKPAINALRKLSDLITTVNLLFDGVLSLCFVNLLSSHSISTVLVKKYKNPDDEKYNERCYDRMDNKQVHKNVSSFNSSMAKPDLPLRGIRPFPLISLRSLASIAFDLLNKKCLG
jgi:hypothetical protein